MILYEGKIVTGLETGAASSTTPATFGHFKEALVGTLIGGWGELALRGLVYSASTAAAGVSPGTSIGTAAGIALYNDAANDVVLVPLLGVFGGWVSGTLGAGVLYWCMNTNVNAAATTGTAATVVRTGGKGSFLYTATLPATATVMRPAFAFGPLDGSTAVLYPQQVDRFDGTTIVKPGETLSLQGIGGAGTSPKVAAGLVWAEVPV